MRSRPGRRCPRRHRDRETRLIGVLVSGEGTNLQALIDAGLPIAAVASNHAGVRALRERTDVKALAHVTGGGILGNLTRVLPEGVAAEIDWESWQRPHVVEVEPVRRE